LRYGKADFSTWPLKAAAHTWQFLLGKIVVVYFGVMD